MPRSSPSAPTPLVTTDDAPPLFVSAKEAAAYLGLSRNEVYRLMDVGRLDWRSHGRRRLVLRASLMEFADALLSEGA